MKAKTFLEFVIVFILLPSCRKKSDCDSSFPGLRIKTINHWANIYSQSNYSNYCYDDKGRVLFQQSNSQTTITWKYFDHMVEVRGSNVKMDLYLNQNGLADSVYIPNESAGKSTYDNNGFLINEITYAPDGKIIDIWNWLIVNGNKVCAFWIDSVYHHDVSYYTEYDLNYINTIGAESQGQNYLGTDSRNLPKNTFLISSNGDTSLLTMYNYLIDNNGRVLKEYVYDKNSILTDSITYTYY